MPSKATTTFTCNHASQILNDENTVGRGGVGQEGPIAILCSLLSPILLT